MIVGIGIDSVEIDRFINWQQYSQKKLQRIFSDTEIDYCLSNPKKSAERFAARFATREAFYKALDQFFPNNKIPFLTLCKKISVHQKTTPHPELMFDWNTISSETLKVHLSVTHGKTIATAIVILEQVK